MKAVAVLFVLSCAIAATYAQGSDFMTMMLLRNMLSGGGGSSGGAASQPAGVSAVGGSGMGQGYPAIGQSANRGGGGSNPLFQMSLLTGGLGDAMRDMTMCQMMMPPAMHSYCMMQFMV